MPFLVKGMKKGTKKRKIRRFCKNNPKNSQNNNQKQRRQSGVPDIFSIWEQAGYVEPNIEEFFGNSDANEPDKTVVTLPLVEKDQSLFGKGTKKGTKKGTEIAERVELVFQLIKADPCITQMEIASKLSITLKQTKTALDNLKKNNRIKREGSARNGKWIII